MLLRYNFRLTFWAVIECASSFIFLVTHNRINFFGEKLYGTENLSLSQRCLTEDPNLLKYLYVAASLDQYAKRFEEP